MREEELAGATKALTTEAPGEGATVLYIAESIPT